ncbi:metallophosphoesterase [Planctomycetota bacterium]
MKIGIISDTHDHHEHVLAAIDVFNDRRVEYVLHAGDIISPFTAKSFANLKTARFIAVFGNNEGERPLLRNIISKFGGEIHDNVYKGELGGKKIFMTHTQQFLDEVINSRMYDLVIYGHTHTQDIRRVENTLIINPGEATDWISGKSYLVILETENMSYEVIPLP